jgi:hypothetical protein
MNARRRQRKRPLTAVQFAKRFEAEKDLLLRRYCAAFALWRNCVVRRCDRDQTCHGDARRCLMRAVGRIPHLAQWQARQNVLDATQPNLGAPERAARLLMPCDLCAETGAAAAARSPALRHNAVAQRRDKSPPARANRFECTDGNVMGSRHIRDDRLGDVAGSRQFSDSRGARSCA